MKLTRTFKNSLYLLCLILVGYTAKSQTTVTIGDQNTNYISYYTPFNNYYNYSWADNVYLSSEIGHAGTITQIAFYVYEGTNINMSGQSIYMRTTSATSFTNSTYPGTSGFTSVYSGSINYVWNGSSGWQTITLTTPFVYDGTSSLEVLCLNNSGAYTNNFEYFNVTTGYSVNRSKLDYYDASFPSTCRNCGAYSMLSNCQLTLSCSPSTTVTPTTATVCLGSGTSITASGASTYSWSPSAGLNTTSGASVTATPTTTTTYSVASTNSASCVQTNTITVTVNALPSLTITPSSATICAGASTTLTASGASNYTWSPTTGLSSGTSATVTANPTVTTTYTLTGKNSSNCVNTKTITVTVNPVNTITVTPSSAAICIGGNTSLIASGASSYSWAPGATLNTTSSATVTATPTTTTTYTVTGNCNQTTTVAVTVNALPTLTITPSTATVCAGSPTTLTATGASTYSWSPSTGLNTTTGPTVTASPTTTTTYTLTGTNSNGCNNTKTAVVTVNPLPTLTITPSSPTICAGASTTLTASGASTYSWSPATGLSATTGASVTANPTVTTNYTITATNSNGCIGTQTATVNINATPSLTVTPNNPTICNAGSATITASGASTYSWSPSTGLNTTSGATVVSNASSSTIYTVSGTGSDGCLATATATVSLSQVNAGTALATGGSNLCSNATVALSLSTANINQVGNGTNSSEKYPFDGYYNYSWSDVIYLQSDLGTAGTLTSLSFYVNNGPSNFVMNSQNIYIRTTSATSFTNSTYPGTSGFTQVFNGTITYNGSGWKTITLNTPFTYDGTSNLEILYENHDGSWGSGFPTFNYTSGYSVNRLKRDYEDASFPSSCYTCGAYAYVPNTQFTFTRTLNNFVKWQSSTDNINYTDISGGTSQSFNTTANTSTYYRAQMSNGTCTAPSYPAYYVTNNNYYVNDNATTGDKFCSAIGNSSNDGRDPSRPNTTVNYILTTYTLGPCDTIFVDAGNYTQEVDIYYPQGGNSSGYTTIHGAGIGKTVFTAPSNGNNFYMYQPDYWKIEGFTMNSTQSYGNVLMYEATHNVLANNKMTHSAYSNVQVFGDNLSGKSNQFLYNNISNSSTNGNAFDIEGSCDSTLIQGDTITMTNSGSQDAMIIYTYQDASNNIYYPSHGTITQNVISAYSYGISLYGNYAPISNFTLSNNKITLNTNTITDGASIWLQGVGTSSTDITYIYNNRLIGGNNGFYLGTTANYEEIYNNYVSNNNYGVYVNSSTSNNAQLYFNSFYNSITNLYFVSSANSAWKVKNNILYTTNTTATNANISVGNATTFADCNYNLFYAPSGASTVRFNSTNYASLAAWQAVAHSAATAHGDENSVTGNPLYNNPSTNNLDLTGSSPGDVAGITIIGITTDIYNHTRFTSPNIGAEEEIPVASAGHDTSICFGSSVQLHGGSGLFYSWAPATGLSSTTIANPIASPTATTQYTLTVTDGAESTTSKITVTVNPLPTITVTASPRPAVYQIGGSVTIIANGANTYIWSSSQGLNTLTSATVIASPTVTTIYTVTGTDVFTCVNTQTISILYSPLTVGVVKMDVSKESGQDGEIILNASGGVPPYRYNWISNGYGSQESFLASLSPGIYQAIVTDSILDTVKTNISLGYAIEWSNRNGVSFNGNNITLSTDSSNFGRATMSNYVNTGSDGWMEFALSNVNTFFNIVYRVFDQTISQTNIPTEITKTTIISVPKTLYPVGSQGYLNLNRLPDSLNISADSIKVIRKQFVDANDPTNSLLTNTYGISVENGKIYLLTGGSTIFKPLTINNGDVLRVGRINNSLSLYKNNTLISSQQISSSSLAIDLTLGRSNVSFLNKLSGFFPGFPIVFSTCSDNTKNWVQTTSYDGSNVIGDSKVYYNYLGKQTQTLVKDETNNNVIATEIIYDAYGRGVLITLPAPTGQQSLCYVPNFITNSSGVKYSYNDFDTPDFSTNTNSLTQGEVDAPKPVNRNSSNTLGWYYSDKNTIEKYVPSSGFPYIVSHKSVLNPSDVNKSSQAGENLNSGSGNEQYALTMPVAGELNYIFGVASGWNLSNLSNIFGNNGNANNIGSNTLSNQSAYAIKNISIDPNGIEKITFFDTQGNLIASCLSGQENGQNVLTQHVSSNIKPADEARRYVDIHLPSGCESTLALYNDGSICYNIMDLKSERFIKINGNVDFYGTQPQLPAGFYRIILKSNTTVSTSLPVTYDLNYYNFSINYYDNANRLRMSIPPNGIDNNYSPTDVTKVQSVSNVTNIATSQNLTLNIPPVVTTQNTTLVSRNVNLITEIASTRMNCGGINPVGPQPAPVGGRTRAPDGSVTAISGELNDNPLTIDSAIYYPVETCVGCGTGGGCGVTLVRNFKLKYSISLSTSPTNYINATQNTPTNYSAYMFAYLFVLDGGGYYWKLYPADQNYYNSFDLYSDDSYLSTYYPPTFNFDPTSSSNLSSVNMTLDAAYEYSFPAQNIITGGPANLSDLASLDLLLQASITDVTGPTPVPNHKMPQLFDYDSYSNLLSETSVDKGTTEYIYSNDGSLRFKRNNFQFSANSSNQTRKFNYISYDQFSRVTSVGEYDPNVVVSGSFSTPYFFDNYYDRLNDPTNSLSVHNPGVLEDKSQVGFGIYLDRMLDQSTYTYDEADPNFYSLTGLTTTNYVQNNLDGMLSFSSNQNSTTWYSYDQFGRIAWSVQLIQNMYGTNAGVKTINYTYDLLGNVTQAVFQKEASSESFYHSFSYNNDKRIKSVSTSRDGINFEKQADYYYYAHGPIKRIELADKMQGIDFVYTINGWIKGFNSPELNERDPGHDGFSYSVFKTPKDLFGVNLDYFAGDYVRQGSLVQTYANQEAPFLYHPLAAGANSTSGTSIPPLTDVSMNLFNGTPKGMRWNIANTTAGNLIYNNNQLMYEYLYDKKYQLNSSIFGTITGQGNLNFGGNLTPPLISPPSYSPNSDFRIWGLNYDPNGNITSLNRNGNSASGLNMDNLSYNYGQYSNKLNQVIDANSSQVYNTSEVAPGQSSNNYTYDAVGRLTGDILNSQYYTYNFLDQITAVYSDAALTQKITEYSYDEEGNRLKKRSYNGTSVLDVWYVRDIDANTVGVYNNDYSNSSGTKLGELNIYAAFRLGTRKFSGTTEQNIYELADQLGNVRTLFRKTSKNTISTGYNGNGQDDYLFDYNTNLDNSVDISGGVGTSVKLNAPSHQNGTVLTLKVYNGESVTASINHFYTDANVYSSFLPNAMLAFVIKDASGNVLDFQFVGVNNVQSAWSFISKTYLVNTSNYSGYSGGDLYLSISPGNGSSSSVWFDNFAASIILPSGQTQGLVYYPEQLDILNYYPHGSVMPGQNYNTSTGYRYGYQGQYAENDKEINKSGFDLREYDALLGRWMSPDPYNEFSSSYLGMGNSPNFADPDGGECCSGIAQVITDVINAVYKFFGGDRNLYTNRAGKITPLIPQNLINVITATKEASWTAGIAAGFHAFTAADIPPVNFAQVLNQYIVKGTTNTYTQYLINIARQGYSPIGQMQFTNFLYHNNDLGNGGSTTYQFNDFNSGDNATVFSNSAPTQYGNTGIGGGGVAVLPTDATQVSVTKTPTVPGPGGINVDDCNYFKVTVSFQVQKTTNFSGNRRRALRMARRYRNRH